MPLFDPGISERRLAPMLPPRSRLCLHLLNRQIALSKRAWRLNSHADENFDSKAAFLSDWQAKLPKTTVTLGSQCTLAGSLLTTRARSPAPEWVGQDCLPYRRHCGHRAVRSLHHRKARENTAVWFWLNAPSSGFIACGTHTDAASRSESVRLRKRGKIEEVPT
jgi:hypothetical protein